MKKILFSSVLALSSLGIVANAQITKGGLPLSMQQELSIQNIPVSVYTNPDWNAYLKNEQNEENKFTNPYIGGLITETNFEFPAAGQIETLKDGTKVWRGKIQIDGAPSIGLLFDRFNLPKGVSLFLTNENRKQVVGAFDYTNNSESNEFAIDVVQGDKVWIELNIAADVDINTIDFNINRAMVMHRGIEHLSAFVDVETYDQMDNFYNGFSSVCMINAICPTGENYPNSRKASIQTLLPMPQNMVSMCSGTLINNTGNTTASCKPYILTASHCERSGSLNNSTFNQMMVRFNFERATCSNTAATNGYTMTGVNILSRSYLISTNPSDIDGDFMLYELRQAIPASVGAVLNGWNRASTLPQTIASPKKYIGFNHPSGDNKKVSASQSVYSVNDWGQPDPSSTTWTMILTEGYSSGGASGSGLFDGDGYLIGDLSTGGQASSIPANCKINGRNEAVEVGNYVNYQKLSHAWEYATDGTANNRRLKPWLDPNNTGVTKLDGVKSDCSSLSTGGVSINKMEEELNNNIALYPNPSQTGKVQLNFNLTESTDLNITVLDVAGKVVLDTKLKAVKSGVNQLDLQHVAAGLYIVKIATPNAYTSKKLMINK